MGFLGFRATNGLRDCTSFAMHVPHEEVHADDQPPHFPNVRVSVLSNLFCRTPWPLARTRATNLGLSAARPPTLRVCARSTTLSHLPAHVRSSVQRGRQRLAASHRQPEARTLLGPTRTCRCELGTSSNLRGPLAVPPLLGPTRQYVRSDRNLAL